MTHVAKASRSNFQLVFSSIPGTTVREDSTLRLNIFNTIIPSIDLEELMMQFMGAQAFVEGGITYGDGTVSFHIDEEFKNYLILYDGIMYINDGISQFGRPNDDYQIDANLILTDNFNTTVANFRFHNIWPKSLGEVDLTYQDGSEKIDTTVSFKYDYLKKL